MPIGLCSQVGFDSEFMFIKSVTQQDYYNVSLSKTNIFLYFTQYTRLDKQDFF